jgi:hypothetical protein
MRHKTNLLLAAILSVTAFVVVAAVFRSCIDRRGPRISPDPRAYPGLL